MNVNEEDKFALFLGVFLKIDKNKSCLLKREKKTGGTWDVKMFFLLFLLVYIPDHLQ